MITATDAAKGESKSSGGKGDSGIDSNTANAISEAAVDIVDKIINKDHIVDSCISLLNKFATAELKPGTLQQQEDLKQELKSLEDERNKVIDKKNPLELSKRKLETEINVNKPIWPAATYEQKWGEKEYISLEIGHLQEKKRILDKKIRDRRGISLIREQCIEIIQAHLQRQEQQRELASQGNGESGKKKEKDALSSDKKQE
ncbi:hypothetical protein [Nitrosospira sp. Nsp1]|uniref:hypothetical protein n=1 Tax=Nitrosospira sp. Nsp1 TaxID=136547 RepID=UPI0008803404|nr:hypothetical protein [Nitrosospira sp. Nsp1]SCX51935.1 hypothetical protein SAMN05720354_11149 [Nitrosospira sp. Nsp1]